LQQSICGEARIVERTFGLGAGALAEAVAIIGERLELQPACPASTILSPRVARQPA
jgi:hypothetical protein